MYINSAGCYEECTDDDANNQYWIGLERDDTNLTKSREGWTWMDGTDYIWMNWENGSTPEPSGEDGCVRMVYTGKWKDAYCSIKYRYLCEKGIKSINLSLQCFMAVSLNRACISLWKYQK